MLTDAKCRSAICPPEKNFVRLTDSGGLYLEISRGGSKRWFMKIYFDRKESRLALGSYPSVSLLAARRARDAAKVQKAQGIDPIQAKKVGRLRLTNSAGDSYRVVAMEWVEKQESQWSEGYATRVRRLLERDLFPWIGERRLADIESMELLTTLRRIEERGALEMADRALSLSGQVWRYGVATGRVTRDITGDLKGALAPYRSRHFAAITDPRRFGELLRAIKGYRGGPVVRAALQLAPILFQRPGELRGARWEEIDLEAALWKIDAKRMKRSKHGKEYGDPHFVHLPKQAVAILRALKPYTETTGLVFPGERQRSKPISENSVRTALISMGYTPDIHTWHGFRASARTILAEVLEFDPWLIEAQLAHSVRDANGRSYNRTSFLEQRAVMMQRWADYLEMLALSPNPASSEIG